MLPGQGGHSVDVFDDKLAVRHPQLHIFQIVGIKPGFLHRLIQGVVERVVRLVDAHALIGQRGGFWIGAEDQANCLLVGLQRIVGVFFQQAALPLRPQPDHPAEGNQAADKGVDQPGDNKLFAVKRQQLQGIYRRHRKSNHRPAIVFANDQIAEQGNQQHPAQGVALRNVKMQGQPGDRQAGERTRRPVNNTHPGGAIAVLGDEKHRHQDPVGLRQVQGVAHQAGDAQHHADAGGIAQRGRF